MYSRLEHLRKFVQRAKILGLSDVTVSLKDLEALVEHADDYWPSCYDKHLNELIEEEIETE